MNNSSGKKGRIIFTDPGYSLLTIGWMFLGLLVVRLLNSLFLVPWLLRLGGAMQGYALLFSALQDLLLFMLVPYRYFRRRYIDHRIFTGLSGRMDGRTIFLCIALSIGSFMLMAVLQYFWTLLLGLFGYETFQTGEQFDNIGSFVVGIAFISIIPAISEEYLFRGVLMRSIQGVHGSTRAVFISAGLFCLMHMNLSSIPTTFVMGLVLGYVVSTTNSLRTGMLMHFAHNAGVLINSFFSSGSGPIVYNGEMIPSLLVYAGIGVFIMGLTMILLKRKGPMRGTLRVNKAAIPQPVQRDLLPFLLAAILMLSRMIQVIA